MRSKIHFQPRAAVDIDEIWDFIAKDSVSGAQKQLENIRKVLHVSDDNPFAGRPRPELRADIRSFAAGSYNVWHTATRTSVNIVRILHGRRKVSSEDIE